MYLCRRVDESEGEREDAYLARIYIQVPFPTSRAHEAQSRLSALQAKVPADSFAGSDPLAPGTGLAGSRWSRSRSARNTVVSGSVSSTQRKVEKGKELCPSCLDVNFYSL